MTREQPLTQRLVAVFLRGNLSPLFVLVSLVLGGAALWLTPREEEPQIVVPMADVLIRAPGLSAEQVERQIATRLEKLLYQIDGVEYVYSMSKTGMAVVTARFYVGEDREDSLVKLYNKVLSNVDQVPAPITGWVVKPVEIDDVPIVIATLVSRDPARVGDHELRRIAEEVEIELQATPNTNRTWVIGGRPRRIRVELDAKALAARQTTPLEVAWALGVSNTRVNAGQFDQHNREFLVDAGDFVTNAAELSALVVNVVNGAPVYLRDVATVYDGPDERAVYTWFAAGPAGAPMHSGGGDPYLPAVHIAVAKKRGANAVLVAREIERRLHALAATHLPDGVVARITRDYGETANHKVNELVENLAVAIVIVVALIALTLGGREALIVAVAVPITFALTLFINYMLGYTINRVTLFALTLALGLVVDDPIVDVENIFRHLRMRRESPLRAVLSAVNEVRPPIILATLAVIVSFLPMFFITGMMGPYMRPMALNVPLSMFMSLVVAFTITPWMSYYILRNAPQLRHGEAWTLERSLLFRVYSRALRPFLDHRALAWVLLLSMLLLLGGAVWLAAARLVPLKMLPFDNKNEFMIAVKMPEGATLEQTDAAVRALGDVLRGVNEVTDISLFAGAASPMDFNGMVRHYYLRAGANYGEIRVNLLPKRARREQSHELTLRLRNRLTEVAAARGATLEIVELPPGPPVLATLVAEVYGRPGAAYAELQRAALDVAERMRREPFVVDVDTTVEAEQVRWLYAADKEKAALSGVATDDIAQTLALALDGMPATQLQSPREVNPLEIVVGLARADRSSLEALRALYVKGRPGIVKRRTAAGLEDAPAPLVQLAELGAFSQTTRDQTIYRKDLERVVYVFGETAGRAPAEAVVDLQFDQRAAGAPLGGVPRPLSARSYLRNGGGDLWSVPDNIRVVWNGEGEWKITLDVFRDLGLAFAAACLGIYLLLVYQTGSYFMPLILMISIPLTMIGIMPGFWLLNALTGRVVDGYPAPVFFTATAMIGMIALAGIAVRNAILLIEFVHEDLKRGAALRDALLTAGAVRFRPIFLTAGTAMLAAWPITLDPIFSGLAWALIFGLFVSTAFTLLVIPVTYDLVYARVPGHGAPRGEEEEAD